MALSWKRHVIGGPVCESVGQFAPARGRLLESQRASRVTGANNAVRRGRHQTRREPRGPGVQHFGPWPLFELVAKELEPILGAA